MRAKVCALLLALSVTAASAQTAPSPAPPLWLRAPAAPEVAWRGMLPAEGGAVGSGGQLLYPTGSAGLAGLLVAVLTHAAISSGVQSAERKKAQDEADRVLEPYLTELRGWPASHLWAAALTAEPAISAWDGQGPAPNAPVAEAVPVFTLAQDEGVLLLDLAVKLTPNPGAAALETLVRVVSSPHEAADARQFWSADGAKQLKAAAASMLAHALTLAAQHGAQPSTPDVPTRTHRYMQGAQERSERAQQLSVGCSRAVLRTLRGWLMSVPVKPAEGNDCARSTF